MKRRILRLVIFSLAIGVLAAPRAIYRWIESGQVHFFQSAGS